MLHSNFSLYIPFFYSLDLYRCIQLTVYSMNYWNFTGWINLYFSLHTFLMCSFSSFSWCNSTRPNCIIIITFSSAIDAQCIVDSCKIVMHLYGLITATYWHITFGEYFWMPKVNGLCLFLSLCHRKKNEVTVFLKCFKRSPKYCNI